MIIIGAGLSGLIAATMLRGDVALYEQQGQLPNNHSALLRFRSSVVGDAVGIPFRKVRVMKAVEGSSNPVEAAMNYSAKTIGKYELRSVITAAGEIEERYIAPPDFIEQLGTPLQKVGKIAFGQTLEDALVHHARQRPIISTVPMPVLMRALGWKEMIEDLPSFNSIGGDVITCDLPEWEFNICCTVYLTSRSSQPYRVSITDNRLIIETSDAWVGRGGIKGDDAIESPDLTKDCIYAALRALGLLHMLDYVVKNHVHKRMAYAKISPIDEGERRSFIMWASQYHGVYSLGRFATWRPGLLLDDLVNDIRVIQNLINRPGETYTHHKKGY